eukprot:6874069-Pyramimonas_sp.AAC.1
MGTPPWRQPRRAVAGACAAIAARLPLAICSGPVARRGAFGAPLSTLVKENEQQGVAVRRATACW